MQVDIEHSYIGDLVVTVLPPAQMQAGSVLVHNRWGGATRNLRRTYDALSVSALGAYQGKSAQSTWQLEVKDAARADTGQITRFGLELTFAPVPSAPVAPSRPTAGDAAKHARPHRPARRA